MTTIQDHMANKGVPTKLVGVLRQRVLVATGWTKIQ